MPTNALTLWDTLHTTAALQGLVNRDKPLLYFLYCSQFGIETDEFWLSWLRNEDGWLKDREIRRLNSVEEAVRIFRKAFRGLVVYDPKVPATSNLASTAAGCEDLLPVRFDPTPGSMYDLLLRQMKVPVRLWLVRPDGTSKFTGRGRIPNSREPSTGSAKIKMVDKMKSDFFSSMSHELRTPLTSIKEGISLLQEGVGGTVTEKQKRLLAILSEESKRLINLVNSLLDLSKMEAGMMTYTFEQESLAPLIGRATTEMIPLVETKKITLETTIDEKLPIIKMDRERILQVLRNLIGNGVKFTPKGGQVRVSARLKNREVEVSGSDTGPGITKENLTTIFQKFHQAAPKNSDYIKGTGLGLAIVKHVITAHGGRVWAESEPGQGSSFIFVLPV